MITTAVAGPAPAHRYSNYVGDVCQEPVLARLSSRTSAFNSLTSPTVVTASSPPPAASSRLDGRSKSFSGVGCRSRPFPHNRSSRAGALCQPAQSLNTQLAVRAQPVEVQDVPAGCAIEEDQVWRDVTVANTAHAAHRMVAIADRQWLVVSQLLDDLVQPSVVLDELPVLAP